jgi:hypothetical protein
MTATRLDIAFPDPIVFAASHPSITFLEDFFGAAPWPLVAIRGSSIIAMTPTEAPRRADAAKEWISRQNCSGYNIYFSPNPLKAALVKKASKNDIAEARWLWADIDPPKTLTGADLDAWRLRSSDGIRCASGSPSCANLFDRLRPRLLAFLALALASTR